MADSIDCRDVSVRFGEVRALNAATLHVEPGEVVALLGPSGCGKTTLLRCIAGLQRADSGSVSLGRRVLQDGRTFVPPHRRHVGLVFQEYALFPHLTVGANVAYGLSRGRASRERVAELVGMGGLAGLEDRYPHQLSGGQQQRVAVLRSLAPHPRALLLDEPFSNLDAALRASMRAQVAEMLRAEGVTALIVTHDRADAFAVADRVAVMIAGRVEQMDSPEGVYFRPATELAAAISGEVQYVSGMAVDGRIETPLGPLMTEGPVTEGPCRVLVRPEWLALAPEGVPAEVLGASLEGNLFRATIRLADGARLVMTTPGGQAPAPGRVRVAVSVAVPAFPATPVDD